LVKQIIDKRKARKKWQAETDSESDSSSSDDEAGDRTKSASSSNAQDKKDENPEDADGWNRLFSSSSQRTKSNQRKEAREEQRRRDDQIRASRELNPYWKDGGTGLPPEKKEEKIIERSQSPMEPEPEIKLLTPAERNAIAAKILKAEMMGNDAQVASLKKQLDEDSKLAKKAADRKNDPNVQTRYVSVVKKQEEEHMSVKQMFAAEKRATADQEARLFVATCSKMKGFGMDADEEYEGGARKKKKLNLETIKFHNPDQQPQTCERCLQSVPKHLILSEGESVYLAISENRPIYHYGEAIIRSKRHGELPALVFADRSIVREVDHLKRALCETWSREKYHVVFWEYYYKSRASKTHHMEITCVPIKKKHTENARMYFKKALMESEEEWSMNKKLIKLDGRCVTKSMPKGLSYFWVSFGDTMDHAYGHVIEDDQLFPRNFAHQTLGGLLDIDAHLWRKPKQEHYSQQFERISKIKPLWKKYDPFRA